MDAPPLAGRIRDYRARQRRVYTLLVEYPEVPPTREECPRLYQWGDNPGADGEYIDDEPHWPVVRAWFSSRAASRRLALLVTYGCKGTVVESDPVTWNGGTPGSQF